MTLTIWPVAATVWSSTAGPGSGGSRRWPPTTRTGRRRCPVLCFEKTERGPSLPILCDESLTRLPKPWNWKKFTWLVFFAKKLTLICQHLDTNSFNSRRQLKKMIPLEIILFEMWLFSYVRTTQNSKTLSQVKKELFSLG